MILDGFINRRLAASGEVVTSPTIMTLDNPEAWRVPGLALELPASRAMKISAVSGCIDIRSDSKMCIRDSAGLSAGKHES